MARRIAGVLPIIHTPFLDDESIDFDSLAKEIDHVFACGADGFGTGMVSEVLRLTAEERVGLHQRLVELAAGRGVVIASVGGESTQQALSYARAAERAGCTGMMAIPPISTALSEEALIGYFRALVESVNIPLVIQDASGYVGQEIPLKVLCDLLEKYGPERVLFKPEASPIGPNLSALRSATGGEARIFEGSGGISLIDSYRRGIAGTMPGVDLLAGIVALSRALGAGDEERAYQVYFPICALVALQLQAGLDGFLAIEKYILRKQGIFTSERRRQPYRWSLDRETAEEVNRLLRRVERAVSGSPSGE